MLFNRHPAELTSAEGIDAYQDATDQATVAMTFIESTYMNLLARAQSPWEASNNEQMQLVYAILSYAQDHTAEKLREAGAVQDKHGKTLVPFDIERFGEALSGMAVDSLNTSQGINIGQDNYIFDDETRANLYPESMLPYWPLAADGEKTADWQGDDMPAVSADFIRGIIAAGQDIEATTLYMLSEALKTSAAPAEYADSVPEIIRSELVNAHNQLEAAGNLIGIKGRDTTANVKKSAYEQAHDAYITVVNMLLCVASPQLLGPDFQKSE